MLVVFKDDVFRLEVVEVLDVRIQDELRRIAGAEVRRKCAALKLASRIVGIAAAGREGVDDADVLRSMEVLVARMNALRKTALDRALGF